MCHLSVGFLKKEKKLKDVLVMMKWIVICYHILISTCIYIVDDWTKLVIYVFTYALPILHLNSMCKMVFLLIVIWFFFHQLVHMCVCVCVCVNTNFDIGQVYWMSERNQMKEQQQQK